MKRKVKEENEYDDDDVNETNSIVHKHSLEQSHDNYDKAKSGGKNSVNVNGQVSTSGGRIKCPYLDTVDRHMIDFDSEKLCSVTLTNMNVYVCLVCGKYFQGRGKSTPLFTHSVQAGHFVLMNLHSGRVYCLPDDYEVIDSSLRDVQRCLSPRYDAML